jgi:hypothetical protein
MLSAKTIATTGEILALTGFTAPRLTQLESDGVIARSGRNEWPLIATVAAIVKYLRDENRRGRQSEAANKLASAKAKALELRIERERASLAPVREFIEGWKFVANAIVVELVGLPPRLSPHDRDGRRRAEVLINEMRTRVADVIESETARLEEAAVKSAKRR